MPTAHRILAQPCTLLCSTLLYVATLSATPAEPSVAAYTWRNVPISGGGFVSGVIFNATQPGLAYALTDVGGAYRWLPDASHWLVLNTAHTRFGFINVITGDARTHGRVYLGTSGRGILVGEPAL